MKDAARLYVGRVVHRRLRPKQHHLSYRVYSLLIDIDAASDVAKSLRFFSANAFNALGFHERDHGASTSSGLAEHIRSVLRGGGFDASDSRIFLLSYPRVFGYVFNPLSVFFSYAANDTLQAVVYEVNNTFGQRQSYVVPAGPSRSRMCAHACNKQMLVSPFASATGTYDFHIKEPGDDIVVAINYRDAGGPLITAHFRGDSRPLTDRNILALLFQFPLMTLKVILGIHYEAFRLWFKGVPLVSGPNNPPYSICYAQNTTQGHTS